MKIEFDKIKSARNEKERRLPFTMVEDFTFDTALIKEDTRSNYPERRFVATGYLKQRLCILCFTPVKGGIRVISLRKANKREIKAYEKEKTGKTVDR